MSDSCSQAGGISRAGARFFTTSMLAVGVLFASGCFSYQEPVGPEPANNETIRVELTGAGQDNLERRHGLRLRRVEGRLLGREGDELSLEVELDANRLGGFGDQSFIDTLRILQPEVREIQVKQFSTSRTVLTSVLGVGAVLGAYAIAEASRSGNGGGTEQGQEPFSLIPILGSLVGLLR